jgi:hypothetical protein
MQIRTESRFSVKVHRPLAEGLSFLGSIKIDGTRGVNMAGSKGQCNAMQLESLPDFDCSEHVIWPL